MLKFFDADPGWKEFGSGIRYGKTSDPGSGINIPDPQHCKRLLSIYLRNLRSQVQIRSLYKNKPRLNSYRNKSQTFYKCQYRYGYRSSAQRQCCVSMTFWCGSGSD